MVLGVNSHRVRLEWRYSNAPSQYFVQFWRQKTGEKIKQISSSKDGNAFDPRNTNKFDASLEATLTLKNVERNEEYTYSIYLLDSNAKAVDTHAVSINVVGKWSCFMSCFDTLCLISTAISQFAWNARFLLKTTRFKFSVEKCHNAHRNSNYHYTVRLSIKHSCTFSASSFLLHFSGDQ